MREKQIVEFMGRLAEKQPQWQDMAQAFGDCMDQYRQMGGMTISLFSDRLHDEVIMERSRLTLAFNESDLAIGMGDFHHIHYQWDEEGEAGVDGALRFALDLVEERMGIASVNEDGHPATLWVFNTMNHLPVTDMPRMVFPPPRKFRWPWHKPQFQLVTNTYHGTYNDTRSMSTALIEEYQIPASLRPPPDEIHRG